MKIFENGEERQKIRDKRQGVIPTLKKAMHNFRELKVWKKAIDFAIEIYKQTAVLPKEEKFGLISQLILLKVQPEKVTKSLFIFYQYLSGRLMRQKHN